MARTVKVLLEKQWSDWGPGEIVELEAAKAQRVVAKGYGRIATKAESKGPEVETADAPPARETAAVPPQAKAKVKAGRGGD